MKTMVRRFWYWFLLIVVGVVVAAFALTWLNWDHADKMADRSILTDSPCAAPCWQEIVPGTPMEGSEIVQILERVPNASSIRQYVRSEGTEVRWRWKQRPWRTTGYNSVFPRDGVVYNIHLCVDFELTVEEILAKYGLPEATNHGQGGVPEHPYEYMNLFYPTQGLQFVAMVLPWDQPVLESTTEIIEAVYVAPAESIKSWESANFGINLQPWRGYGELEASKPLPVVMSLDVGGERQSR